MAPLCSFVRVFLERYIPLAVLQVSTGIGECLRIGNDYRGMFFEKCFCDTKCRRFPRITGIRLERESEHSDTFFCDGVEHGGEHVGYETAVLIIVYCHYLFPVFCRFDKSIVFTQVHKVENILFKT